MIKVTNIPAKELEHRIDSLQKSLQKREAEGALLLQNMSKYYFTGTLQCQYVYVPSAGECLGIVRKGMERAVRETSVKLRQIRSFNDLPALLTEAGLKERSRLGLEFDVLPVAVYQRLQAAFSGMKMIDISYEIREVRKVKSAFEISLLEEAAVQAEAMYTKVPSLLVEGKKEITLAAELEYLLRSNGHEGLLRMRAFNQEIFFGHLLTGESGGVPSYLDSPTGGSGLSPAQPQGAGRKKIKPREPISIDYSGIYQGYIIDQTRVFAINGLPANLMHAFETSLTIQEKIKEMLMPGKSGGEIYAAALSLADRAGLAKYFMGYGDTQARFVGHGVGLEVDEFPVLAQGSRQLLEAGVVVAVEPKFVFPGQGVVGIENTWHVTDTGAQKITLSLDDIVIV